MVDRVLVAMSGGVDSSVAAARLVADGWDVVGVTLHLWDYPDDGSVQSRCCAPEDVHDARRVADTLGIPHYAFDRRDLFRRRIVEPFVQDYLAGRTPSPCVQCNKGIKLRELFALAERLDAHWVATGHYARVHRQDGIVRLGRAVDRAKDQSYFLHAMPRAQLERMVFPLGELDKQAVRRQAVDLGLPGATKGESQELCFVPTGRYDAFVAERAEGRARPGPIVDDTGRVVGEHDGVFRFTVGQRRNLGVALGHRAYVVGIDPETATVRLGARDALARGSAMLANVSLGDSVTLPIDCDVAVRYRGRVTRARVEGTGDGAAVHFQEAVNAVVPGQVAVFYDGDFVLGGGTIVGSAPPNHGTRPQRDAQAEPEAETTA